MGGLRAHTFRARGVQAALLAVVVAYLITTIAGSPLGSEGIGQTLAYAAAAALCLVRIPASSPERAAWRLVAAGLGAIAVASASPMFEAVRWAFFPCAAVALVLFMRSRIAGLPWSVWIDGIVVGLGAATVGAAVVVPRLALPVGGVVAPIADLTLLALVVFTMSSFRWRPATELWWLAAGLVLFGCVDAAHAVVMARGSHDPGRLLDAASVVATVLIALAPGRPPRIVAERSPPIWAPLAAPLIAAGTAVGTLIAQRYFSISPVAGWLAVATLAAAMGRLAMAFFEARQAGQHAHQARTDELTGLLNRRGFYDRASIALSQKRACALLLLDLDHFKDINDSLGHSAGDQLLRAVATRLVAALGEHDIAARLGGDEFAFLLADTDADDAKRTAGALLAALKEGVEIDGVEVQTDASIGIAVSGDCGHELGTLLRHADIAMYRAKRARSSYMLYAEGGSQQGATRAGMELLAQLRKAIEHGDLALHYHPMFSLTTGAIVGAEALVRWPHPSLGLLYPDEFLPLARHNSLMHAMTEFVVERALDDARRWQTRGHRLPVAINLSPPTFADRDLPSWIADALRGRRLTAADLVVEITEDFVLGNIERARPVLDDLRSRGVKIAIDDFGVGYSALAHLRQLPIDAVKLDRSFIAPITTDRGAAAIVRSVIDLSHTLNLTTVAEGVESAGAVAMLRSYGCEAGQGHYFCRPVDAAELWLVFGSGAKAGNMADMPKRTAVQRDRTRLAHYVAVSRAKLHRR